MATNRYLLAMMIVFFMFLVAFQISDSVRTKNFEDDFLLARKKLMAAGKAETWKVLDVDANFTDSKVFYVETVTLDDKSTYQVGRIVNYTYSTNLKNWYPESSKIIWDSRKNSGNRFTFPPYFGKDWAILFKK